MAKGATLSADAALRLADDVQRACSRTLGESVAGVILHGSLTLGDYIPGRSDVDLLMVVEGSLTDEQIAELVAAVAQLRAPERVDLRVVTRQVASAPKPAPSLEAEIVVRPGLDPSVHVDARHQEERDVAVELSVCRTHGRSLAGAAASELIGEVPDEWIDETGNAQLAQWQALPFEPQYAELMVLTACRVWRFRQERRHCSKLAAGRWALARDPKLQAVHAALRRREDPTVPIEERDVRRLLAEVRARVSSP